MKDIINKCDCNFIHDEIVGKVKNKMPEDEKLYDLADLFKVFGDSTRIKILWALDKSELCVCDLSALLGMTKSAISHQLKSLRESKLVKFRKSGKIVFYSLDDSHIKDILEKVDIKRESDLKIKLYQGLPKGPKMEMILQKLTEVGVDEIILVQTKRTVVKVEDKKEDKKIERWARIIYEAAKQSKRGQIPKLRGVLTFKEALADMKENDFKLMPEELEAAITPKTKALLICSPNNPTGTMLTKADLEKIADIVKKHDLLVISDEIYAELSYDEEFSSFAAIDGLIERTILINGFSKGNDLFLKPKLNSGL